MWIAIANGIGTRQGVGGGVGPTPPPYTPPLDSITAAVAYSVRKLSSTYTGDCMLVRRVSDGVTQSIGFGSDGLINDSALSTFSGGSELTVQVWYDQGPNGVDLEQTNSSYQPTIYDGSSVTVSTSGKPCVRIVRTVIGGPGEWLQTSPVSLSTSGDMDVFLVLRGPLTGGGDRYFWNSQAGPTTSGARWGVAYGTNTYHQQPGPATNIGLSSLPVPDSLQFILNAQYNPSANINTLEGNGSEFGTNTSSTTYRTDPYNVTLGARTTGAEGYNTFDISEIIHLPTYDASENLSLGSNINSYYNFTNWSPTSGFLADYPNAAAAYSVRKLSNTAIKCMRVRRFVPPYDEQDIGFTPAGDLDEAAIVAFGGTDILMVSKWYDQSGQSRHAIQDNPNSQPEIYNGTAVWTLNEKPSINQRTDNYNGTFSMTGLSSSTLTVIQVVDTSNSSGGNAIDTGRALSSGNVVASFRNNMFLYQGIALSASTRKTFDQTLGMWFFKSTDEGYQNGTQVITGDAGTSTPNSTSTLLGQSGDIRVCAATQELIIYESDESGYRTALEANINSYYDIYTVYNTDPATSGFLFDYPDAAGAYSVRQLNNNATSAMRVMRAVAPYDEAEIGFVSGELDEQAIVDFAQLNGGNDVLRVSAWYDQSGQQNHALQDIKTSQPEIYDGTSVIQENGKAAIDFDGNSKFMEHTPSSINLGTNDHYVSGVLTVGTNANSNQVWLEEEGGASDRYVFWWQSTNNFLQLYANTAVGSGTSSVKGDQYLLTGTRVGTTSTLFKNGVSSITGTASDFDSTGDLKIGINYNNLSDQSWDGVIQEVVIWPSNQSIKRPDIETDINDYFEVIVNDEAATSGFLFDYPNADVAYSVRQLNNNATYSMQVERSDGHTKNIGFDSNGDLDTQAIIDFAGASVATVSVWYDQSGAQNHAKQNNPSSQPQIYDGTSVTDVIGRPGVDFYNVIDRYMQFPSTATSDFTVSYVGALNGSSRNSIVGQRGSSSINNLFIRTSFLKINVGSSTTSIQSGYGSIAAGLNAYSIITENSSSTATVYRNNTSIVSGTIPSMSLDTIGGTDTGNAGVHSEIILWGNALSVTDRTAVYNNQDTYFSIP